MIMQQNLQVNPSAAPANDTILKIQIGSDKIDIVKLPVVSVQVGRSLDQTIVKGLRGAPFMQLFGQAPIGISVSGVAPMSTSNNEKNIQTYFKRMCRWTSGEPKQAKITFKNTKYNGFIINFTQQASARQPNLINYAFIFVGQIQGQ